MRLQKFISACGVCSRRRAEEYILAGRVTVNGKTAVLGMSVDETADQVCLDGRRLVLCRKRTYVMLHKPRGYVTTMSDPQGRPTVADLVKDAGVRLYPAGRLDFLSEGLLIMTDDGETANRLMHPSNGVTKTYHVSVRGDDPTALLRKLTKPVEYRGVRYRPAEVRILRTSGSGAKAEITLREGKNREIRNMCAAVGLTVERLIRVAQGGLTLGDLPAGKWRYLTEEEAKRLQVGGVEAGEPIKNE